MPVEILPEALANQIAAGEVVERPASVVKELVENAIDARASRVFVEVEEGGRDRICVADDGEGMSRSDAMLAIRRHATSKIRDAEDLHAIQTLGFRGEALPSIASVSQFTLLTRPASEEVGTRVRIAGGAEATVADAGCAPGTQVEVRDLFFNIPARLKFLKARATEMGHISRLMTTFALGNPAIHFRLRHNGRDVVDWPPDSSLKDRIHAALGAETCRRLHEVHLDADVHVHGFVSEPEHTRPGTAGIHAFVNGRAVREKVLHRAISTAYGESLERGRYPHAVLYLEMPPEEVDVNVHPTKHEVRFVRSGAVFECVARAIRMTLGAAPWHAGEERAPAPGLAEERPQEAWAFSAGSVPGRPTPIGPGWRPEPSSGGRVSRRELRDLRALGVLAGGRIACEAGGALVLLDARGAMEAQLRRQLREELAAGGLVPQPLLFPEQMELESSLAATAERHADWLCRFGFEFEAFGGRTWALKSIPAVLLGGAHGRVVRDLLDELQACASPEAVEARVEALIAALARGSEPGDPASLPGDELQGFVAGLGEVPADAAWVAVIPEREMARWFRRS
jgi:DNA mismatch repair protein MutL